MKIEWRLIIFSGFVISLLNAEFLSLKKISERHHKPIYLTTWEGCSDTLFIAEQHGLIQLRVVGENLSIPLLDIRDRVHQPRMPGDERGLLGIALHPQFLINGRIYVNYVDQEGSTVISEFKVDLKKMNSEPHSEKEILTFKQPYSNHNGGQLAFGPDGFLYIAVGDGGSGGDPHNHGQNPFTLFGTILRLDVSDSGTYHIPPDNPFINSETGGEEVWCYGLRNPWRFSFDRENGDLYIGDVGQNSWEEIDYVPIKKSSGVNFGWNNMEGAHCFEPKENCSKDNFILPIFEYPNNANYMKTLVGWEQNEAKGCSVTGGYVYRGKLLPALNGNYFFGDYCTGKIWSFKLKDNQSSNYTQWEIKGLEDQLYLSSFGEDGKGELYFINHTGSIYKLIDFE